MRRVASLLIVIVCISCVAAFQAGSDGVDHDDAIRQAILKVHKEMTDAGPNVDRIHLS